MIANLLIAASFTFIGIVIGAMVLDRYHNERTEAFTKMANAAEAERHATAGQLAMVRAEHLVDALSREIAVLKAQRSHAEALHAERIRSTMEAARWN